MSEAITFKKWYERGEYLVHRGHPIFFHHGGTGGDGESLLLLHGFPTSSWDWHHLWPELCRRFAHVLSADMIGFGYSAKPRDYDYSIADQADLQESLLRRFGISHYHVLAHDYGDTVTQELLARGLERVGRGHSDPVLRSACLLNAGLFPELQKPTFIQRMLQTPLGPWISRLLTEQRFHRSLSRVFGPNTKPSFDELSEFWQQVAYNGGNGIAHRLIHYLEERHARRARWVGALAQTRVPLRLINGPRDPVSGEHMAEAFRSSVSHPDVVSLPGIGHYPQLEAPQETLRAFLEFFERIAPPRMR